MTQRILVIRFSSLGDILLTSPTLVNLRIAYPEAKITLLTKERFLSVARLLPEVNDIVTLREGAGVFNYIGLLMRLSRQDYDLIIDLHGNYRSWLARHIVGAERVARYPKRRYERATLVKTNRIPREYPHTIDLYNDCLLQLEHEAPARRPVIPCSRINARRETVDTSPTVVIAPGAAHPNKQWPLARFADVARAIHRSIKARIDWVVVSSDAGQSDLKEDLPAQSFSEVVDEPIPQLASRLAGADLVIANDSGIGHLASAAGTPVISIFGPTHPALGFAPRGLLDQVVEVDEHCRPCSLHGKKPCYRDRRYCFDRIDPDGVVARAVELLASGVNRHPALFVDRDGTLIVNKHYLSNPDEIEFEPNAVAGLKRAQELGLKLIIISNQSGVARGYFDIESVEAVNRRLLEMLTAEDVAVDGIYYCPYHRAGSVPEYTEESPLRKPAPGMAEEAAEQLGVDLRRSFVIGDSLADFWLGRVLGVPSYLVRTGYGVDNEPLLKTYNLGEGTWIVDDIRAAVDQVEGHLYS